VKDISNVLTKIKCPHGQLKLCWCVAQLAYCKYKVKFTAYFQRFSSSRRKISIFPSSFVFTSLLYGIHLRKWKVKVTYTFVECAVSTGGQISQ